MQVLKLIEVLAFTIAVINTRSVVLKTGNTVFVGHALANAQFSAFGFYSACIVFNMFGAGLFEGVPTN